MARLISAMYDTRAEAETARARLSAEAGADHARIIAKETAAALDTLKLPGNDLHSYREGLSRGGHLLIAEVPQKQEADRIIRILEQSRSVAMDGRGAGSRAQGAGEQQPDGTTVGEVRIPQVEEEVRIGKRLVERGGARVRSVVREIPVEESVSLRQEHVDVGVRPADRRLSEADVQSAGLLKDRVIEVSEMREEPVITKAAVVREEVILKKTVTERTETVRDTVRHTEVEVEEYGGDAQRARDPQPVREVRRN